MRALLQGQRRASTSGRRASGASCARATGFAGADTIEVAYGCPPPPPPILTNEWPRCIRVRSGEALDDVLPSVPR